MQVQSRHPFVLHNMRHVGISAGAEVTISYGPWPNEVYLAYFGFLPYDNPFDSVVLFDTLPELVGFHDSLQQQAAPHGLLGQQEAALADALGPGDWNRYTLPAKDG